LAVVLVAGEQKCNRLVAHLVVAEAGARFPVAHAQEHVEQVAVRLAGVLLRDGVGRLCGKRRIDVAERGAEAAVPRRRRPSQAN